MCDQKPEFVLDAELPHYPSWPSVSQLVGWSFGQLVGWLVGRSLIISWKAYIFLISWFRALHAIFILLHVTRTRETIVRNYICGKTVLVINRWRGGEGIKERKEIKIGAQNCSLCAPKHSRDVRGREVTSSYAAPFRSTQAGWVNGDPTRPRGRPQGLH